MQTTELENRMTAMEQEVGSLKGSIQEEITAIRVDFEKVIERHSNVLERVATKIETALYYQRDSLPINLVMKLFTFFCGLVIVLLSAVFGIKWAVTEMDQGQNQRPTIERSQNDPTT